MKHLENWLAPSKCLRNSLILSTQTYWAFRAQSYMLGPVLGPGDTDGLGRGDKETNEGVTVQVAVRTRKRNKAGGGTDSRKLGWFS